MRNSFMKFSFAGLILLASLFFVSSGVMAQGLPQANYSGGFDYNASTGQLDFNSLVFNTIVYDDGSPPTMAFAFVSDPYSDPLINLDFLDNSGYLNLGTFQQDSGNQNLFHATSGTNLSFTSVDWVGNTTGTYLTADLNSIEVINDAGGWHFNLSYNLDNITNVASTGLTGSSEFANEFVTNSAFSNNTANLSMSFTFSGPEGFGATTSGTVSGIVAAPEPISSVLFLSGGAVLAARRFRKIKTNRIS